MTHIADNHDALLDYLYEEGDPAERLKIAQHLQQCAACAVAVLELQTVRGVLREWTPPAPQLGFRIVQDGVGSGNGAVGSGVSRTWSSTRWVQAAAAVVLFAAGMAASQFHLPGNAGVVTTTENVEPASLAPRGEWIQLPPESGVQPVAAGNVPVRLETPPNGESYEQLLQRVRAMIEQSETRQQRELALRLSQVANEVETQHRADLLRIQQTFGQLEMETGAQFNHQQQQIQDYLVRTSGGAK